MICGYKLQQMFEIKNLSANFEQVFVFKCCNVREIYFLDKKIGKMTKNKRKATIPVS